MVKRVLLICGVLLLLAGIGLGIYIYSMISSATSSAQALDKDRKIGFVSGEFIEPSVPGDTPPSEICPSAWSFDVSKRVISEKEALALNFTLSNQNTHVSCTVTINLKAPGFDTDPNTLTMMENIPAGTTLHLIEWYVVPKQAGTWYVDATLERPSDATIKADGRGNKQPIYYLRAEKQYGISVRTVLGVSPFVAAWASVIGSTFGATIATVLSFKWWRKQYIRIKSSCRKEGVKQLQRPRL